MLLSNAFRSTKDSGDGNACLKQVTRPSNDDAGTPFMQLASGATGRLRDATQTVSWTAQIAGSHNSAAEEVPMNEDRYLRMPASAVVMLGLGLGYWVSPYWYLFSACAGLNLFQSAFTNWCLVTAIFRKLHIRTN